MTQKRIETLLSRTDADAVYISSPQNRYYFSGFTGTAGSLLLTRGERVLFTDSRYTIQARQQAEGFTVRDGRELYEYLKPFQLIGVEEEYFTVADFRSFSEKREGETCDVSGEIWRIRQVKDASELALLREAARIADDAFSEILTKIAPGKTERELALELEFAMRRLGAEELSFETIFASGARGAMPHGTASDKAIERGDLVTMDFGCKYHGYCSDMTRTVAVGEVSAAQRELYEIVLEAQKRALSGIRDGARCAQIDALARDYIKDCGHGAHFGHALGHSVGLDIHETPACGPKSTAALKAGMLMTAEPGVYVDGFGGVRIEDLVIVTAEGYENLTHSPKELIVL